MGIALLAGHANANTTEDIESTVVSATPVAAASPAAVSAEDALNAHDSALKQRGAQLNALRLAHMKEFQARYQKEQQQIMQTEIKSLTERGEYTAMFSLMKNQATKMKTAMEEEQKRFMALHGQIWDPKKDGDGAGAVGGSSLDQLMQGLDQADAGGLPMVRPGDASE